MNNIWLDLCAAQRVPTLGVEPANAAFSETGLLLVRDKTGSILPLGSFDICDRTKEMAVFPCYLPNTRDYEHILAAASGLMMAWNGLGVVTFRFACQPDSFDFVLLDVMEGSSPYFQHCCALRGLPGEKLLENIESGGSIAEFGAICALSSVGIALGSKLVQGARLTDVLRALPAEALNKETMLPWYARLAWPEEINAL